MTATATLTPLPAMPIRPDAYNELVLANNAAVLVSKRTLRAYMSRTADWDDVKRANNEVKTWRELINEWWATPEGEAYRAEVDAYEIARLTRKAERQTISQTRANETVVRAVRSAACPRCFSTHAGEC